MKHAELMSIAPVLSVNSRTMKSMVEFFVKKLGFSIDTVVGKPPAFAMLKRATQVIMLACRPKIPWPHKGWAAYIWVNDVKKLYTELQKRNAPITSGPILKDYGCLEIEAATPDKRRIVFGQVVRQGNEG